MEKKHLCECGETEPQAFRPTNRSKCIKCVNLRQREYYKLNRERERQRYQDNRESRIEVSKEYYRNNIITARINAARNRCKKKNYAFEIVKEDVYNLMEKQRNRCAYSNRLMSLDANDIDCLSLDRIDSSKGYTLDNLQLVTTAVNYMKSGLTEEAFFKLTKEICVNNKLI